VSPILFGLLASAGATPATVQRVLTPIDAGPLPMDAVRRIPDLEIEASAGGMVQVRLPVSRLGALDGLARARPPHRPQVDEERLSEGLADVMLTDWHALGLTGDGVRVAVVDSGFAGHLELLGGELPDEVETHFHALVQLSEHGTAVAEIIHDMAPDAELVLYSFDTEVEFLEAVEHLMEAEVDVVNCCVSWDNVWHPDDDNPLAQAVNALAERGVLWVHSAGNDADNYLSGPLEDADGDGWLELGGLERIPVEVDDGWGKASLRWDEPYGEAAIELAVGLYPPGLDEPCGWSDELQDGGGDPWEGSSCETVHDQLEMMIHDPTGAAIGARAWAWSVHGMPGVETNPSGSIAVPSAASGALAVGAAHWWDHAIAPYSSQGPSHDGRTKPDLSAPTVVSTSTYDWLGFNGTSAAAPHVSGAAALLVQATGHELGPKELQAWLAAGAIDLGDPGEDDVYGAGYLQLSHPPGHEPDTGGQDSASPPGDSGEPARGCGCVSSTPAGAPWALLPSLVALLRRRRG